MAPLQVVDGASHFRAFCDFCVTYSCRCALFLEVHHKAAGGLAAGEIEVCAAGAQCLSVSDSAVRLGIAQLIVARQQQHFAAVGIGDLQRSVGALERARAIREVHIAVGVVDGDAGEHRVHEIIVARIGIISSILAPLHDIRLTSLDGRQGIAEVQRQRAVVVEVRCRQQFLHCSVFQRCAREVADSERQHQRVPVAVLVEGAAGESHVGHVAVGITDGRAVVGVVGQADADGRAVEVAVEPDAVLVCLHHAVVVVRVGGGDVEDGGLGALVGGQVIYSDVVAVGDGGLVGGVHAGEGVGKHSGAHAGGNHERVLDDGAVIYGPADEAAAVVGAGSGGKGAVEHAAFDVDVVLAAAQRADESAVGAVAADAAVDADGAAAVIEFQRAERLAHDAGGLLRAGVDGAVDVQVRDDGVLDVAERGAVFPGERLCVGALREGQRMAVAVEDALERFVIADARHFGDADAGGQLHDLAAEASAAVDAAGEDVPFVGGADDVGVVVSACAVEEPRPRGADGDVGVGHGEGGAADGAGRGGVAAEGVARLAAVSQGEADALAAAGVVGAAVADAVGVGRDAVRAVGGGGLAETAEGHVVAGCDGAGLRALVGGQVVGGHEVTVFDGERAVVAHLGEGVAEYARAHAGGLQQRVADDDGAALTGIAHKAAAVGGSIFVFDRGGNGAVEHAAVDGDRVRIFGLCASRDCGQGADQSAITLTIPAVHVHRAAAVDEVQRAFGQGNDAARSP